jgi:four helix bundle protein
MATYKRFEDLPVWRKSADLAARMFDWTTNPQFKGKGDLANQLQRATLSVSNNIAEGFERGSTNELIQFLYIARGSAGEVRSMLCVIERMWQFEELGSDVCEIKKDIESVSRQIRAWTDSLQNSEIKGQRHLNDASKQDYERSKRRSQFLDQQAKFRAEFEAKLNREAEQREDSGKNEA